MFRRPGTGRSKASADTLCQKCLKRGHYSYECKAPAQERPYKSRPSRTQQLLNPKLQPKLTTEVPTELLRKKGVADEILRKKEEERRRSRSPSSSADSVSTISTNRSPSRSPSPPPHKHNVSKLRGGGDDKARGKRRRRSVSTDSRSSDGNGDRNTRRRMSSFSPGERGRRRSRSRSSRLRPSIEDGAARFSRDRSGSTRSRSRGARRHDKRPYRRLSPSSSRSRTPDRMDISEEQPRNGASRGRWGASPPRRAPPPRDSRNRSPSPYSKRAATRRSPVSHQQRNGDHDYNGPRHGGPGRNRFGDEPAVSNHRAGPPPPPSQRERSLSPFSKRVALTRAMQAG